MMMSSKMGTSLYCDVAGCLSRMVTTAGARTARKQAESQGWTRERGRIDRCPSCIRGPRMESVKP